MSVVLNFSVDHDIWDSANMPQPVDIKKANFKDYYDIYEELGE